VLSKAARSDLLAFFGVNDFVGHDNPPLVAKWNFADQNIFRWEPKRRINLVTGHNFIDSPLTSL
jgi:hypothetical protein